MDMMLIPLLASLAFKLPMFIIWVVGISLAISRKHSHPKASKYAIIALAIFILSTIINTVLRLMLPLLLQRLGLSLSQMGFASIPIYGISELISIAAWVMLLTAVFAERGGAPASDLGPPAPPIFDSEPNAQNTATHSSSQ